MTCIAGYVDNDKNVWIGGDSAGCTSSNIWQRSDSKVFVVDKMIYGFTTSFRMGQILRFSFKRPIQSPEMDDYEYLCTIWVDELRKCLKEKGYIAIKDSVETGGSFLIGYKGKLYCVESDFQVGIHSFNYDSCGCGQDFALASLFMTEIIGISLPPVAKIELALQAASKFSTYVREPFVIECLRYEVY